MNQNMDWLLTNGLKSSIRNLRTEFRIWLRHLKSSRRAKGYSKNDLDKLHLGCGPNHKKGWLNIDLFPPADLTLDLREKFPFSDNSFSLIYSEHFFEHIDYPGTASNFLSECFRILKPHGLIRIGVPDTEWPLQEYCKTRNDDYFNLANKNLWHPDWCRTEMEHINYHFRQDGEHKFAYDLETLSKVMLAAGFIDVMKVNFDPEIDSETRKLGTLYVKAIKP